MKTIKLMILLVITSFMTTATRAQDDVDVYNEAYARSHIAYTDFMRLGVTSATYAKCLRTINYYEPGKVTGIVNINGEEFRDDGTMYDLVANDGILTSTKPVPFEKGTGIVSVGTYQMPDRNAIIYDERFNHRNSIPEIYGFSIKCTFVWVSCNTWPENIRGLCVSTSWPFNGYFNVTECELGWESRK